MELRSLGDVVPEKVLTKGVFSSEIIQVAGNTDAERNVPGVSLSSACQVKQHNIRHITRNQV